MKLDFSIIVPVYNRPDEIEELLESLSKQTDKDFEIIVVEDGSDIRCEDICSKHEAGLNLKYYYKKNEKPAIARNYGIERARGNYYIFVDSDCILPPEYIETVRNELENDYVDCYGGPDMAHESFSTTQKAINYSMTSFITTGGIRGGSEKIDKFHPRSFNLGYSKEVNEKVGGYPVISMHPGEDMVLAIEIIKQGFKTRLLKNAFVYHKRRTNLKQFFKQVFRFSKVRLIISKVYPETFKLFFYIPTVFVLGCIGLLALSTLNFLFLLPFALFALIVFFDALRLTKNIGVAFTAIVSTFLQLVAYGTGFLRSIFVVNIMGKDEYDVFEKGFYK